MYIAFVLDWRIVALPSAVHWFFWTHTIERYSFKLFQSHHVDIVLGLSFLIGLRRFLGLNPTSHRSFCFPEKCFIIYDPGSVWDKKVSNRIDDSDIDRFWIGRCSHKKTWLGPNLAKLSSWYGIEKNIELIFLPSCNLTRLPTEPWSCGESNRLQSKTTWVQSQPFINAALVKAQACFRLSSAQAQAQAQKIGVVLFVEAKEHLEYATS